jgi:hypothetical protein
MDGATCLRGPDRSRANRKLRRGLNERLGFILCSWLTLTAQPDGMLRRTQLPPPRSPQLRQTGEGHTSEKPTRGSGTRRAIPSGARANRTRPSQFDCRMVQRGFRSAPLIEFLDGGTCGPRSQLRCRLIGTDPTDGSGLLPRLRSDHMLSWPAFPGSNGAPCPEKTAQFCPSGNMRAEKELTCAHAILASH